MHKFIVYFRQLPPPVKYSTCFYFGSLLLYNTVSTYYSSKKKLMEYRNNDKIKYEYGKLIECKNISEWDAVKFGASENFGERLFDSFLWPVNLISNTIPILVLSLNPDNRDNDKQNK